jgi:hypothetical protein
MFNQSTRLLKLHGEYGQFPGGKGFFMVDEVEPLPISELAQQ